MNFVDKGIEKIEEILASYPNGPELERFDAGASCYDPVKDKLCIPRNPLDHFQEAFHELIHSTGHPTRLNRWDITQPISPRERELEEILADIGSFELYNRLGMLQKQFWYNGKTTSVRWFYGTRSLSQNALHFCEGPV